MDEARFDALTKTLGVVHTRRGLARLLGGLSLGGALSALGTSGALAAKRKGGAPCNRNAQCKTGKCVGPAGNKQCSCSKQFKACVQPAVPCKQAACHFATKLCVTTDKAVGTACPDDGNKCTDDVCDGSGVCTHPDKSNGVSCGDGKTCQNGECTGGLTCPSPCAGDKICDGSTGFCTCPASRPVPCRDNTIRCTTDPNTDEERCGPNCVDCAVSAAPGSICCGGVCVTGCGPNTNSGCDGPCGPSCTPCSGGQLCCNLGFGTSSQCVDPHPVSRSCPPPP